jgi:nicotinamidase-related amidase
MSDAYRDTLQDYKRKGFADRVGYGKKPVLLIVDFINGFTDPASPLGGDVSSQLAVTNQLLAVFRAQGLPVAYTVIEYDPDFLDAGLFIKKVPSLRLLGKGSQASQVDDRIRPQPGELIVSKKFASAFFGTGLDASLKGLGVDTIVMTGCTTSGCVRASAIDGLQYGYHTIVVREGVGDRAQGPHEANLFDIDAKYGDVVSLQETLGYLRTVSGDGSLADKAHRDFDRWWNQPPARI